MDNPLVGLLILALWFGLCGQVLLYAQPYFDSFVINLITRLYTWAEKHQ